MAIPMGFPIPGRRLLSGQLRQIEARMVEKLMACSGMDGDLRAPWVHAGSEAA